MATEVIVKEGATVGAAGENPEVTAAEPIAEAAVEIAEIQAERDVKIAEIEAETSVAQTEAIADMTAKDVGQNEWQRSIEMQISELRTGQTLILERLTPAEPPPPSPPSESEVVPPVAESLPAAEPKEPRARPKPRHWI